MLAVIFGKEQLRSAASSFFIDNLTGMCSLIKGSSRKEDLSSITTGIHIGLVEIESRPWFDYVETKSNSADGGSRIGLIDPVARQLGITLRQHQLPAFPVGFPYCSPDVWTEWWRNL